MMETTEEKVVETVEGETVTDETTNEKKDEVKPNRAARRAMGKNHHRKASKKRHMDDKIQWFRFVDYLNKVDQMRALVKEQDNVVSVDTTTGEVTPTTE